MSPTWFIGHGKVPEMLVPADAAAAVAIALVPTTDRPGPKVGVIRSSEECSAQYRECVDRITQRGYARFPV